MTTVSELSEVLNVTAKRLKEFTATRGSGWKPGDKAAEQRRADRRPTEIHKLEPAMFGTYSSRKFGLKGAVATEGPGDKIVWIYPKGAGPLYALTTAW